MGCHVTSSIYGEGQHVINLFKTNLFAKTIVKISLDFWHFRQAICKLRFFSHSFSSRNREPSGLRCRGDRAVVPEICLNKHNNKQDVILNKHKNKHIIDMFVIHEKVFFNLTISPSRVSTYCGASPHLWVIMHLRSIYLHTRNISEVQHTYEVFTEVGVMPSKYYTFKIWVLPSKSLITSCYRTLIILLGSTIPGMPLSIDVDASYRIF